MTTNLHIQTAAVTGATGFIGRWLLVELTRHGVHVCALVRDPAARLHELRTWVTEHGGDGARVSGAALDLSDRDLGLTADGEDALQRADAVYHLAARFEFGLSVDVARVANVDAAVRLVEKLAERGADRPPLQRLVHLSGYRTEGQPARALDVDDPKALASFYRRHGAYEASKMEAHERVARRARELEVPLTRVSPAVVIGHSQTGETSQFVGLADTLRMLRAERLPALPGDARTWLPLVTVDFLAQVLAQVPGDAPSRGQHLVVLDEDSPSLARLVGLAAALMEVPAPRWHLPVGLVRALPSGLSGVDHEALSFLSADRYDSRPLNAFAQRMGLRRPDVQQALLRWVEFLHATDFGELRSGQPREDTQRFHAAGVEVAARGDRERAEAVMLHGVLLDGSTWGPVREGLERPTLALDLPGLGRSEAGGGTPAEWLRGVLAPLTTKPVLVGHSLGCLHALELAHAHPERVGGVVLVSPFFLQARPAWLLRLPWLMSQALRWLKRLGPERALGDAAIPALTDGAMSLLTRPHVARENAHQLAWAARVDVRARLQRLLDEVRVPVTLVHGERDPLVVPKRREHPTVAVVGAGHYPQLTHPGAVQAAIEAMLAGRLIREGE